MDPDEIAALEASPDLAARLALIEDYAFDDDGDEARKYPHVIWLVTHHPEVACPDAILDPDDGDVYATVRDLWVEAARTHPGDLDVLTNAIENLHAEPALVEQVVRRAASFEPTSSEWHSRLAQHWIARWRAADDPAERIRLAREAVAELEIARAGEGADVYLIGVELARSAHAAGDDVRAAAVATELIDGARHYSKTWYYGNAIHHANLVLGEIALAADELDRAKRHLLAAGLTRGSPQLDSVGPDFTLATALLARGERDTVANYLELCARFWKLDGGKLATWRAAIAAGEPVELARNG